MVKFLPIAFVTNMYTEKYMDQDCSPLTKLKIMYADTQTGDLDGFLRCLEQWRETINEN